MNIKAPISLFIHTSIGILLALIISGCQPQTNTGFAQFLVNQGAPVEKPANLHFPRDHSEHPEFGIEWWYLTANLTDQANNPVWMQWTLFRTRSPQPANKWSNGQFYMAHFSVHTSDNHFAREKFAQGGVGNVEVNAQQMFIDNWQIVNDEDGRPARLTISDQGNAEVTLNFDVNDSVLLQGEDGFSEKYPESGLASYYYSLPDIAVSGTITLHDKLHKVEGIAWFDHEWSSAFLNQHFIGWQWFSLHLDNNQKLMLFALKPANDSPLPKYWYGKYRTKNNEIISLLSEQIQLNPLEFQDSKIGNIPSQWRLQIPDISMDVEISTMKREQISPFSILYYEGAVSVSGSTTGVGFVEITQ